MILFKKAADLSNHVTNLRNGHWTVGFVPTMGALHEGHLALIQVCKKETDVTVCSIFVNPTQFTNQTDFKLYPSTLDADIAALLEAGCDILFLPGTQEIYHPNIPLKQFDLGELETILEGHYRPGHFQGVCQAVDRLLTFVNPHKLILGQKDYQQCLIIERLLKITNRTTTVLKIVPTTREDTGLALSSRNRRLSSEQHTKAVAIYKTLNFLKTSLERKSVAELKKEGMGFLNSSGFEVDYVAVANAADLHPVTEIQNEKVVGLIAATIGNVRLIDNMPLN